MTSNPEGGLAMFAICKEITSLRQVYKQDYKGQQKRGRPRKMCSDEIRNDTGLPLLTAARHAINRTEWRGATSPRTARSQYGLCIKSSNSISLSLIPKIQNVNESRRVYTQYTPGDGGSPLLSALSPSTDQLNCPGCHGND